MLVFTLLTLFGSADAAPMSLLHTGRLTDGAGTPLNGPTALVASLHTQSEDGMLLWTGDTTSIDIQDGYYTLGLANGTPPLDSSLFNHPEVWIQIAAGGVSLGRTQLHSVPYALESETTRGVPMVASQPTSCNNGEIHFDTTANALRVCEGSTWTDVASPPPSLDCTCASSSTSTSCGVNSVTATLSSSYVRTGGGCHDSASNERQLIRNAPTSSLGWNCRSTDEDQCRAGTLIAYSCGCRVQ